MVPAVIVVPELSCDEDFLASDQAIGDCATHTLAGFFFILIVVCTVKESVPGFDGLKTVRLFFQLQVG